jgi:L-lysine 6-transaminase
MTTARGRGLMIACDLPTPEARDQAVKRCFANGLIVLKCGVRSIRFRPPLDLAAAEADAGLDILERSLREL